MDYGFNNCRPYIDGNVLDGIINDDKIIDGNSISVKNGTANRLKIETTGAFQTVLVGDEVPESITKRLEIIKDEAPVQEGETVARIIYELNGNQIGSVDIIAAESVDEERYKNIFINLLHDFINIHE